LSSGERIAELAAELAHAATPIAALRKVTELRRELDVYERQQVGCALAEGSSFAAIARHLGVTRQAVHRRFRDAASSESPLGTAPGVARILRHAREEATAVGADGLGSEHILLATLRAVELPASAVLRDAGVTLERARTHVEAVSPRAGLFRREERSRDLRALLARPAAEARKRGSRRIEVEHLLLAALEDEASAAVRAIRALGVDADEIRRELGARLESPRPHPDGRA
jgi:ATP-dependent Clp protease ATP-binding subunit ClpA